MLDRALVGSLPETFTAVRTNEMDGDCKYDTDINQMVPEPKHQNAVCAGCGNSIVDRYFLLVADQHWHLHCLRCADCQKQLDSQLTCFVRDSLIFCKQDYHRRYSRQRCTRCNVGLSSNELVMRARDSIYHIDCFLCFSCNKPLVPGDTYGIHSDHVFCQEHYEHLLNNFHTDNSYFHEYRAAYAGHMADMFTYCEEPVTKSRSRKRKHMLTADGCLQSLGIFTNERGEIVSRDAFGISHTPRQKRVRTSFKHHQLRAMKSYFATNHNPDAKDLKELSRKTQLSKRVLQVWFQNARAKYRRSLAKQDSDIPDDEALKSCDDTDQLLDLSKCHSPSALSDVSSSQSMTSSLDTNNQSVISSYETTEDGDKINEDMNDIFHEDRQISS